MLGRTFACLGVLAILSAAPLLTAPARAAWGPFTSLPTTQLVSDPSCAAIDPTVGSAICGGIGPAGQLMFSTWNGSKWSAWTTVSVSATSAPSCANAETGQAVCAVRNSALQMVAYEYAKGAISKPLTLTATLGSAPGCGYSNPDSVVCAGRGPSGHLVSEEFNPGSVWAATSWISHGASFVVDSSVSCTGGGTADGDMICGWVTTGTAGAVAMYNSHTSTWSIGLNLGGHLTNPPVCAGAGVLTKAACFGTGTTSNLYINSYNGSSWSTSAWSGWDGLGGLVQGYSCAEYGLSSHQVNWACGVTGITNSGFWTNDYNGSSWSGWVQQGTETFIGSPSCFELDVEVKPGRVMCVLRQEDGQPVSIIGP